MVTLVTLVTLVLLKRFSNSTLLLFIGGVMANISGELGYKDKNGDRKLTLKQQCVLDKVALGYDLKDALKSAGYPRDSRYTLQKKFSRYLDSHPKMVRKASEVRKTIIDRMLDGDTNYIAAAERISTRVQERIDPIIKQTVNTNLTMTFTKFDVTVLQSDVEPQHIDIDADE